MPRQKRATRRKKTLRGSAGLARKRILGFAPIVRTKALFSKGFVASQLLIKGNMLTSSVLAGSLPLPTHQRAIGRRFSPSLRCAPFAALFGYFVLPESC